MNEADDTSTHFRQPLLRTPFHERGRALSQVDSFVPWAGYTTVDVFTNVGQEYFAVRNACSVYDLTPMVKYRIAGPDAQRYLNRLVTRDLNKLKVNRVSYCVWCNDEGHIIDDGTVFRFGEQEYRLCTAERQLDWLLDSAIGFDVEVAEVTDQVAALALQGPTACSVLHKLGLAGVERLKPFEFGWYESDGRRVMVSRTGFTGDLGYELWVDPAHAVALWDALMVAGRSRGIRAIGSRALNMVRIEAGFLLPNVDFVSAENSVRLGTSRTPLELGLAWLVDFGKGHFTGRPEAPTGWSRHRRQQAGDECAAVLRSKRANRSGQRDFGDLVANLQTQHCACYGRCASFCVGLDRVGGDLPEPRAGVGATHVPGASRREAFLRA